jgi:hypothetical protein
MLVRIQPAPERAQSGVRMDKRLLKAMKALAELQDRSLGELFEHLVLSALAGTPALDGEFLTRARELCGIYGWPTLQSEPAAPAAREDAP